MELTEKKPKGNPIVGLITLALAGYIIYECVKLFLI
jgi:hypothetical protein